MSDAFIRWFDDLGSEDLPAVGGKNASLGEMIRHLGERGVRIPGGFAVTATAYRAFLAANRLEEPLGERLDALERGEVSLREAGEAIRRRILTAPLPDELVAAIRAAYARLGEETGEKTDSGPSVAVRSSATAEDLPEASFAGQQESFLNVRGADALLEACHRCFASLFTDRAISYREEHGFAHLDVALSVGVQRMVRSDRAGAGVLFTLDPETGFPDLVVIDAAWGLGESVVKGTVNPDGYRVFKPLLDRPGVRPIVGKRLGNKRTKLVYGDPEGDPEGDPGSDGTGPGAAPTREVETSAEERRAWVLDDDEILQLARWGEIIEDHYGRPMDIEWAKDGVTGELFVVQARPETVESRKAAGQLLTYRMGEAVRAEAELLAEGAAVGSSIAVGRAMVLESIADGDRFRDGDVLVTGRTDPDWVPVMRRAAAIVTERGGRTSHAAIVSRELGIPAVVGAAGATTELEDGLEVTVSCAEGETGRVYRGALPFEQSVLDLSGLPTPRTRLMMNLAHPEAAWSWWRLPARGVGLARMELIIDQIIQVHPMALLRLEQVADPRDRRRIEELTEGYADRGEYFVEHLARGLAAIAASQYPEPVIVRTSDFKTNEYANLLGGRAFEPEEENPMLGWRGASRYDHDGYRDGFALECRALRRAREEIGLDNIVVMIPFCRTVHEADRVLEVMASHGLERGVDGLEVYMMCEVPSNVVLAERFAERFDGFSIGSNDLTQLTLGVDRDSALLADLFDERDEAVQRQIADVIERAHRAGIKIGICGQAPSDHPDFADFLVECGIDSISLNPDSVVEVLRRVAATEERNRPRDGAGRRAQSPGERG